MTISITKKIVDYNVINEAKVDVVPVERRGLHEGINRPERLHGATYKIKTPTTEHAFYITINHLELDGQVHPFEIFINSKAMDQFQWIVAMTRMISAVFRKGGDYAFLVDEMRSVFDPKGGYFRKGGQYVSSLVAEIGMVLEQHLVLLGLIKPDDSLAQAAREMVMKKTDGISAVITKKLCNRCGELAVIRLDGCDTCTSCGASHCG